MQIKNLTFKNFRNLKDFILDTNKKNIVLIGKNGQGKTNLLEAIYILCYGTSFRTKSIKECISYKKEETYLKAIYEDFNNYERINEVSFDKENKIIRADGKEIKDRKNFIYNIPCINFSYDDVEIIKGEAEERRRFFDQIMTITEPCFLDDLRKSRFYLKQRNAAIKTGNLQLLDIYDESLVPFYLKITEAREKTAQIFDSILGDMYSEFAEDSRKLHLAYRPSLSGSTADEILEQMKESRETDLKMNTTTCGIHRDRFNLTDENGLFVNGASTGQIRVCSLVFRNIESMMLKRKLRKDPVFLFDDVLLELDSKKREKFLSSLGDYSQSFYTFLPKEHYFGTSVNNALVYTVKNGEFTDEEKV